MHLSFMHAISLCTACMSFCRASGPKRSVPSFLSQWHSKLCHFILDIMDYFFTSNKPISLATRPAVNPNLKFFIDAGQVGPRVKTCPVLPCLCTLIVINKPKPRRVQKQTFTIRRLRKDGLIE